MTILFLNPTGRIGGAETALLEVLGGLAEAHPSWRLALIVASEGPLVARARGLGAVVRVLPFPAALARLGEWSVSQHRWPRLTMALRCGRVAWPAWRYLTRLRKVIAEFAPEILHTNGLKMHLLGALARPAGTALVWHLHDYVTRRPFSAGALRRCAHRCSAVIAPSESVANDFRALGGPLPPVHAIWNAVDLRALLAGWRRARPRRPIGSSRSSRRSRARGPGRHLRAVEGASRVSRSRRPASALAERARLRDRGRGV